MNQVSDTDHTTSSDERNFSHFGVTHIDPGCLDYLVDQLRPNSFLDIGCGKGKMVELAKAKGLNCLGIELDPSCPDGVSIIPFDLTQPELDLLEKNYDLGWAVEILPEIPIEEIDRCFGVFSRCENLIVTVPSNNAPYHRNSLGEDYWIQKFRENGFVYNPFLTEGMRSGSTMRRDFIREHGLAFTRKPRHSGRRWIEVTTIIGCSLKCSYCPQQALSSNYPKEAGKLMTFQTFTAYLEKLPISCEIHFAGFSEPWLNPEATKMVLHAADRGHEIIVHTTLRGMTSEDFAKLRQLRFKLFSVHLPDDDGLMQPRIDSQFKKVLSAAVNQGLEHNPIEWRLFGKLHREVQSILSETSVSSRRKLLTRASNIPASERESLPAELQYNKVSLRSGPITCSRSRALIQNVLLPNGDVQACCCDYGLDLTLGNLMESSYESLWESHNYAQIISEMAMTRNDLVCRKCESSRIKTVTS